MKWWRCEITRQLDITKRRCPNDTSWNCKEKRRIKESFLASLKSNLLFFFSFLRKFSFSSIVPIVLKRMLFYSFPKLWLFNEGRNQSIIEIRHAFLPFFTPFFEEIGKIIDHSFKLSDCWYFLMNEEDIIMRGCWRLWSLSFVRFLTILQLIWMKHDLDLASIDTTTFVTLNGLNCSNWAYWNTIWF